MIDDLEEQVAELVLQPVNVVARDRVGDLVSLFDGVGRDRFEALLHVPRTARIGIAQARHDVQEIGEIMFAGRIVSHGRRTWSAARKSRKF